MQAELEEAIRILLLAQDQFDHAIRISETTSEVSIQENALMLAVLGAERTLCKLTRKLEWAMSALSPDHRALLQAAIDFGLARGRLASAGDEFLQLGAPLAIWQAAARAVHMRETQLRQAFLKLQPRE